MKEPGGGPPAKRESVDAGSLSSRGEDPGQAMSDEVKALLEAALRLSREERAQLAVLLTDFVEGAPGEEIERAWLAEAKRRLEEVGNGRMRTIPAEEVERKLWDMLERGPPETTVG